MGTPAATGTDLILKKVSCVVSGGMCQVVISLQQQVTKMFAAEVAGPEGRAWPLERPYACIVGEIITERQVRELVCIL